MKVRIFDNKRQLGEAAANDAAAIIRSRIEEKGNADIIAATGASQFEFLDALVQQEGIDWSKTRFFHLDEYVGLPEDHPASFRKYLKERIVDRVHPGEFNFVNGNHPNPAEECRRLANLISGREIDVAFVGIGENGHLAFNDPPADFETEEPYLVVELDEDCRRQQMGEGWFQSLEEVPRRAISMSIKQILKSREILCVVPDERKARAVQRCLEEEISPMRPASILRRHSRTTLYLDRDSASLLHNPEQYL
ncbi:MAG TPA: glucosamine-6-phosphate deaminase [Acidobacteriota bacterium]|nr:glucosamine-6-phosphate deaminase [Acidobacteriota bacterium]